MPNLLMQPMALSHDNLVCHGMPCYSTLKAVQPDTAFNEFVFENYETTISIDIKFLYGVLHALNALIRTPLFSALCKLINLSFLRSKHSTIKLEKELHTTVFPNQGINSKKRDNWEDENQFKSHGHFVSKDAR